MAETRTSANERDAAIAASLSATVEQLKDYLRWKTECGIRTEELDNTSVTALFSQMKRTTPPAVSKMADPQTRQTPPSAPTPRQATIPAPARQASVADGGALAAIARRAAACSACNLCKLGRSQVVPGQGNWKSPDVMFVGEAPGADEDVQGLAFVGRAGQLLTKMIAAMGYTRDEVFIANICKCRPPNNRQPTPEEMTACLPFLKEQIAIVKPKTIVAMGNTAIKGLLDRDGITRLRGNWLEFEGIPLMPTLHPAYLLRFPPAKVQAWEDLQKVMAKVGKKK